MYPFDFEKLYYLQKPAAIAIFLGLFVGAVIASIAAYYLSESITTWWLVTTVVSSLFMAVLDPNDRPLANYCPYTECSQSLSHFMWWRGFLFFTVFHLLFCIMTKLVGILHETSRPLQVSVAGWEGQGASEPNPW